MAKKPIKKKSVKKKTTKKKTVNPKKSLKNADKKIIKAPIKKTEKKEGISASLKNSAILGIIALFLVLVTNFLKENFFSTFLKSDGIIYSILLIFITVFMILYMLGYAKLGFKTKNFLLAKVSYFLIIIGVIESSTAILSFIYGIALDSIIVILLIIYGLLGILFGNALFGLTDLGSFAKITGWLNIFVGALMLSIIFTGIGIIPIILPAIGVLMAFFVEIFNISLLFKASKIY